ncbi:MAG: CD1845 family protein [Clostridiales bacterium]|jgi:hypothetical protein|nr:CD1845 family protein [Clostridiales bacterium]
MRILFKIIAAPFVVVLTILWAMLVFLFSVASGLLKIVCGLGILCSPLLLFGRQTTNGLIVMFLAFLISPAGLPLIAEWLIDRVADLNDALKGFITT